MYRGQPPRQAQDSRQAHSPTGEYWVKTSTAWVRRRVAPRRTLYVPTPAPGNPALDELDHSRQTLADPGKGLDVVNVNDNDWRTLDDAEPDLGFDWTGITAFPFNADYSHELPPQAAAGAARPKGLPVLAEPTPTEAAERQLARLPFRSWRTRCAQNKSRSDQRKTRTSRQPVVQLNYGMLTDDAAAKRRPLAVFSTVDASLRCRLFYTSAPSDALTLVHLCVVTLVSHNKNHSRRCA